MTGDPALLPIADHVAAGERLGDDDGVTLFRSPDLLGLGRLADAANRARHGDRVTFAANQHINPTNICILRKTCVFCSFARLPKEDGAYHYTLDEVLAEADSADDGLTREFHIVGGLDMHAGLDYYAEMFRGAQGALPARAHQGAHGGRAGAHRPDREDERGRGASGAARGRAGHAARRRRRGVQSRRCAPQSPTASLSAEEWLDVHRVAHRLGIRSNCTMLYGHVETIEDRVAHLAMLRDLQDETGGFLAYIPLAYHPDHNELGATLGREGTATTGFDDLRNLAVARLYLDNIRPHQDALDHGHAVPVTGRSGVRRGRLGGHGRAREDLPRGWRSHSAAHVARLQFFGSFAERGRCRSSVTRFTK